MHASIWTGLETFFSWVLQTTWQGAVLALLILVAQFLLRHRLAPAWRHGLWLLLVARLLMPLAPSSAISVFNLTKWSLPPTTQGPEPVPPPSRVASLPLVAESSAPDRAEVPLAAPSPLQSQAMLESHLEPSPAAAAPVAAAAPPISRPVSWRMVAAWGWLAGVLMLGLRFFWLNHRFNRRLAAYLPVSNGQVGPLCRSCAQSLGLKGCLEVVETPEVESPAVYGIWRQRLLVPDGLLDELSPEELRHVLLHELAHIKRRDPELNGLVALLQILHWFNPVLWFAFARMRADRELATDELALARTEQRERTAYGETVLKVLERLAHRPVLPGLVGIGESKAQIQERIRAIARGHAAARWRWAAGVLAVVLAGIALTNAREEHQAKGINLLQRYPTTLKAGDAAPDHARPWQLTPQDLFQVSQFKLEVGKALKVETGPADLGIGHCTDGAVWAVLIPRAGGKVTSSAATNQEEVANVWLRFHPAEINRIFPPESVTGTGAADLEERLRSIAEAKFTASWHAGNRAMIPEPKDMTVDVDTQNGPRRFFTVDTAAKTAEYAAAFAGQTAAASAPPAYEPEVDTNRAQVVSVTPANGAQEVDPKQELRIRFDRPMNPYNLKLEWNSGGFQLDGSIQVSADQREFRIPVRLTPGQNQSLVLNRDREREMWVTFGKRPEMKPKRPAQPGGGFMDAQAVPANEFRWSFSTKALPVKPEAPKPRLVSASPASGATTPVLTRVELTFDQPMWSPGQTFPHLQKANPFRQGVDLIPSMDYDPAAHRFTLPVLLPPDDDARLILRGFYSAEGVAADPVVLHYQTGTETLDPGYTARAKAAAEDPKLQKLLASMKEARARIHSGVETVQTVGLMGSEGPFRVLEAQTATFKWQGENQIYADITGPMSMTRAFILGSDGQNCWLFSEDDKGKKRLEQTPTASTHQAVALLDPFELADHSVGEVLAEQGLVYAGEAQLDGRACYRIEKWNVEPGDHAYAMQMQWWVDQETFLPRQIVSYHPNSCSLSHFDYQRLNQSLPESEFRAPAAADGGAQPLFFEKEPQPGEQRFLRISDGSNGRMSGRIGYRGPKGTTSSGMN